MARKKHADSEETHRSILRAARHLLNTRPTAEVSMRRIAADVDLSIGTLSYYFGSREELFEAVLDDFYERVGGLGGDFISLVKEDLAPLRIIEKGVRKALAFGLSELPCVRLRFSLTVGRGELHPRRQGWWSDLLKVAASALSKRWGGRPHHIEFGLRSLNVTLIRLMIATPGERREWLGAPPESSEEAVWESVALEVTRATCWAVLPPMDYATAMECLEIQGPRLHGIELTSKRSRPVPGVAERAAAAPRGTTQTRSL